MRPLASHPPTQHPSSLTGLLSEQMAMKSLSVFGSTPSTLHLEDTPQALTTPTPSKATLGGGGGESLQALQELLPACQQSMQPCY